MKMGAVRLLEKMENLCFEIVRTYQQLPIYRGDRKASWSRSTARWTVHTRHSAGVGLLLLVGGSAIVEGMKKVIRRKAEEKTKRQIGILKKLKAGIAVIYRFNEEQHETDVRKL